MVTAILVGAGVGVHTVRQTAANPQFFVEHLNAVGTYQAIAEELAPGIAREQAQLRVGRLTKTYLAEIDTLVATTLNRDVLAEVTVTAITDGMSALRSGETPILVPTPTKRLLESAGHAFGTHLPESVLFQRFYERLTTLIAREFSARSGALPFGVVADANVLRQEMQAVAPRHWIAEQLATQLPSGVRFLLGESETLDLRIALQTRQEQMAAAVQNVVQKADLAPFVLDRVVRPTLCKRMGGRVLVVQGDIKMTDREITGALDGLLSTDWGKARRSDITTVLTEWLTGKRQDLTLEVPLAPLKAMAADRITGLVVGKVKDYLKTLETCTGQEARAVVKGNKDPLSCNPSGLYAAAFRPVLISEVSKHVNKVLEKEISSSFHFDEVERMVNEGHGHQWAMLQKARNALVHGVTIHEGQVRKLLRYGKTADIPGAVSPNLLDPLLRVTRGQGWASINVSKHIPADIESLSRLGLRVVEDGWRPLLAGIAACLLLLLVITPAGAGGKLVAPGIALLLGGGGAMVVGWVAPRLLPALPDVLYDVPIRLNELLDTVVDQLLTTSTILAAAGLALIATGVMMGRRTADAG